MLGYIERERDGMLIYIYRERERERERDGMLVGDDAELIEKSVMPNFLHVIPIVDCTRHATQKKIIKKKKVSNGSKTMKIRCRDRWKNETRNVNITH
jgi:hypothetical protein